jgi:hypothetical protein
MVVEKFMSTCKARVIVVAATGEMSGICAITLPRIKEYAERVGAELYIFEDMPDKYQHPKYRMFEAAEINGERILILDADILIRNGAPDIFEALPTGNHILDEAAIRAPGEFDMHKYEVCAFAQDWADFGEHWWSPGVVLMDAATIRQVYQMPTWDVRENLFSVGKGKRITKNMPWVNLQIAKQGIEITPLDFKWNCFVNGRECVKDAYFWHCAGSESNYNANGKVDIALSAIMHYGELIKPPRVHCVISRDQHNWILGRMWRAIQETAPEGAICTDGERPMNQAGVINYYNPYRGYRHKTQGHDVVFCTHPEIPATWARATRDADHIVVMADKWRQHLIEQGVPAHKITHIPPGVDGWFLDPRLRIFNPCKMPDGSYGARKGRGLWQRLCAEPWLECICSGGAMSEAELRLQYLACDVVVSTAVPDYGGEGGPMSCREGLALCKPTVMPAGIGLVDEHADHPCLLRYPAGDYDALIEMLRPLYHAKVNVKMASTDWTWEAWGKAHWDIFNRLIPGLTQPQAAPQARRVKDKTVPLYFGDNQRDKSEILEYVTNKGFIPVEADAPDGAIDLTAVAGKPMFARNRYIKQHLGAYK